MQNTSNLAFNKTPMNHLKLVNFENNSDFLQKLSRQRICQADEEKHGSRQYFWYVKSLISGEKYMFQIKNNSFNGKSTNLSNIIQTENSPHNTSLNNKKPLKSSSTNFSNVNNFLINARELNFNLPDKASHPKGTRMHSEPALRKYKVKEKNLKDLESFLDGKDDEIEENQIGVLNEITDGILKNEEISSNPYVKQLSKTIKLLSKSISQKNKKIEEYSSNNNKLQFDNKILLKKLDNIHNESTAAAKSKNHDSNVKEVNNLKRMNTILQEQLDVHEEKQEKLKKVFEALKNQGIELGEVLLEYLSSPENDLEINEGSGVKAHNSLKKEFKKSPSYTRKPKTECSNLLESFDDADESIINESAESSFHFIGRPEEQSDRYPKKMEMTEKLIFTNSNLKDRLKLDFNKLKKNKEEKK